MASSQRKGGKFRERMEVPEVVSEFAGTECLTFSSPSRMLSSKHPCGWLFDHAEFTYTESGHHEPGRYL